MPVYNRNTGCFPIQFSDPLWHMKINFNLAHIDTRLLGQVVQVAPDLGISAGQVIYMDGSSAIAGFHEERGFLGVVQESSSAALSVVYMGEIQVEIPSAVVGHYAVVTAAGNLIAKSRATILSERIAPIRIVGVIAGMTGSTAHVLVRSKGFADNGPVYDEVQEATWYGRGAGSFKALQLRRAIFDVETLAFTLNKGWEQLVKEQTGFKLSTRVLPHTPITMATCATNIPLHIIPERVTAGMFLHCTDLQGNVLGSITGLTGTIHVTTIGGRG